MRVALSKQGNRLLREKRLRSKACSWQDPSPHSTLRDKPTGVPAYSAQFSAAAVFMATFVSHSHTLLLLPFLLTALLCATCAHATATVKDPKTEVWFAGVTNFSDGAEAVTAAAVPADDYLPTTARIVARPIRIRNGWSPLSGYLVASSSPTASSCRNPSIISVGSQRNRGTSWILEPGPRGALLVRSLCGGSNAYLERGANWNGNRWVPDSSLMMGSFAGSNHDRQLWEVSAAGDNCYKFISRWESRTGVLTRRGSPSGRGTFSPTADVMLLARDTSWSSQCWEVQFIDNARRERQRRTGY